MKRNKYNSNDPNVLFNQKDRIKWMRKWYKSLNLDHIETAKPTDDIYTYSEIAKELHISDARTEQIGLTALHKFIFRLVGFLIEQEEERQKRFLRIQNGTN